MNKSSSQDWRVGVDIGGTFTDVVLWCEGTEKLVQVKLLTTPDDPSRAVIDGVGQALEQIGVTADQLKSFVHGTTLVANALIERKNKEGIIGEGKTKRELQTIYADLWSELMEL